jgi:hypothetical protein
VPDPTPKKKTPIELDSLARCYTEEAIRQVAAVLSNDVDTGKRLQAASILFDRGWGRPRQDNSHEVKGEIKVVLRKMLEDDEEE